MATFIFYSKRQLFFYVNIDGQRKLVSFGERDSSGESSFQTENPKTAEAIRQNSYYKKGVIVENTIIQPEAKVTAEKKTGKKPEPKKGPEPKKESAIEPLTIPNKKEGEEVLEVKNFTQAKSVISKKLGIAYNSIKTPDQLAKLAKDAGYTIVYVR